MSTQDKAIVVANEVHEIAQAESNLINSYCTPKYNKVTTKTEITNIDNVCLPAKNSYYAVKLSWIALVTMLNEAKSGTKIVTDKEIQDTAIKLSDSLTELRKVIEVIQLQEVTQ